MIIRNERKPCYIEGAMRLDDKYCPRKRCVAQCMTRLYDTLDGAARVCQVHSVEYEVLDCEMARVIRRRNDNHIGYHNVHAAPAMQPAITLPKPHAWLAPPHRGRTPFSVAANVVANGSVGSGPPLTVTVAAPDIGDGWVLFGDVEEGRMVKRGEVPCSTPCVELINMRK